MITQETIHKIFDTADIVDVIGDFVDLKRSGSSFKGLSPFTNENTPSFFVAPDKNIFKCFSSGVGGNVVSFLMEHEKLSYPGALKYLADKYNIEVEENGKEEDQVVIDQREKLFNINAFATNYFAETLYKPEGALGLEYARTRFTDEEIIQFRIGFALDSWSGFLDHATSAGYSIEDLLNSKLISKSKKVDKYFDYFRGRLLFPIENSSGRILGFGGRILPGADKNQPKYFNSPDTLLYDKSSVLYGLNFARKSIIEMDSCILVEGYTDVISLHSKEITNTVAPCGTSLQLDQIALIKRYTRNVYLAFDGDTAGRRAMVKNSEILLQQEMFPKIIVLPEGEDPDTFISNNPDIDFDKFIKENSRDFIMLTADTILRNIGHDPMAKHNAINELCRLIAYYHDTGLQNFMVDEICRDHKIGKKQFQDKLKELNAEPIQEYEETIPSEVDPGAFHKWGFYEYKNEYYFRTRDGTQRFSNFVMKPLFHVESINDTKRIYELVNHHGFKIVVDFDMQEMTALGNFRRNIEGKGNFLFWGTEAHMNKLKLQLYEDTKTCYEIKNLGWQREGFWAWANGITTTEGFNPIDENGLVEFNGKYYFIPAFSKIYLDDKSIFMAERKFSFRERDITLRQWADKIITVFGDNARISIAFWIASVFRDYILHVFKNFPILNLFGPKGTGKSQLAMSMSCLFGEQQTPFNIHNGTKPGLAEHLQQFCNAFAWIDEYKNNLEYDKVETLKSIYDSIGRNRLNINKGMKKETTMVNSAAIVSGQEMMTADVALFSRVIFLQFHKTEFTMEEKQHYDELKKMESKGLSHLTAELISHRDYFLKNFYPVYEQVLTDFSNLLENANIEDRILRSMCSIIAAFKTVESLINLPFTYEHLKPIAQKSIKDQNNQIGTSNEIAMFWDIIEALFDENIIIDRWHFKIDMCSELNIKEKKDKKLFNQQKEILKLKFTSIYKLYAEHSRKSGQGILPSSTLKYYLENSKLFEGVEKSTRFTRKDFDKELNEVIEKQQITTAYCFDYKKLGVNLTRESSEKVDEKTEDSPDPDSFIQPGSEKLPF